MLVNVVPQHGSEWLGRSIIFTHNQTTTIIYINNPRRDDASPRMLADDASLKR